MEPLKFIACNLLIETVPIYLLARPQRQCQRKQSHHEIIAVTVSLGRLYACRICSIFSLCKESNASDKAVALTERKKLLSKGSISSKAVLSFPKNFLNFRSDMIKKQGRIKKNLSKYSNKSYIFVVLCDPVVVFFEKRRMPSFVNFSVVFWLFAALDNRRSMPLNFFFHTPGSISSRPAGFFAFNCFLKSVFHELFKFIVELVINNFFGCFVCDFRRVSKQILEMFFPLLMSFFYMYETALISRSFSFHKLHLYQTC